MPALAHSVSLKSIAAVLGGGRAFTPASLFAASEPGGWYDPSDLTTLYQDAAGTTPVTAVEQPVGLVLDKSRGLVLGSELVSNGTFDANVTGWQSTGPNATVTWSADDGGSALIDITGSGGGISDNQTITVVAGRTYVVTARIKLGTYSGTLNWLFDGNNIVVTPTASYQTFSRYYVATDTDLDIQLTRATAVTGTFFVSSISVRELPGSHLSQSTAAARPVLSARVNQLTHTEAFDNASWATTSVTVSTNQTTAPDGTNTADLCTDTNTTTSVIGQSIAGGASNVAYTALIHLKRGNSDWVRIQNDDGTANGGRVWVNLATGELGTQSTFGTATLGAVSLTSVSNGFYRLSIAATIAGTTKRIAINSATADGSSTRTTNGTYYIWGADLRPANAGVGLPAYQRVGAATDYDTTGFPYYLRFDGTDDFLQSANINFSATDKVSLFAGTRKVGTTFSAVVLAELTTSLSTNNGGFLVIADNELVSSPNNWRFYSRGTTVVLASTGSTLYPSPDTRVLTGLGDVSGDITTLRLNGALVQTTTTDQGTGNYSNAPLYVGARFNAPPTTPTGLFFNGHFYSLIVRGAATDAATITATETWVNQRTKAF